MVIKADLDELLNQGWIPIAPFAKDSLILEHEEGNKILYSFVWGEIYLHMKAGEQGHKHF